MVLHQYHPGLRVQARGNREIDVESSTAGAIRVGFAMVVLHHIEPKIGGGKWKKKKGLGSV